MKQLLSSLALVVMMISGLFAQSNVEFSTQQMSEDRVNDLRSISREIPIAPATRTTQCAPDTLLYALFKNASGSLSSIFYRPTGIAYAGQWYPAPGDVTVSGATILADVFTPGDYTVDIDMQLWQAGADSLPTGAALATKTVTIDSTFALIDVDFDTPVEISAGNGFVITLFNPDQDSAVFFRSNSISGQEGEGERNGIVGQVGTAGPIFAKSNVVNVNIGGPNPVPYNVDFFIFPFVSYSINSDFIGPMDCAAQNQPSDFINTSSDIAKTRYYNGLLVRQAFTAPTQEDFTFEWVFVPGDTVTDPSDQVSYTFTDGQLTYDVELSTFLVGLGNTVCLDDTTISVASGPAASALFSLDNFVDTVLEVGFLNQSSSDSVLWNFGDGETSTDVNPTHTYGAFGTYTVSIIAFDACGNDTISTSITLVEPEPIVSIASLEGSAISIYPNPSQGLFTISVDEAGQMTLKVSDLVGREILRQTAKAETTLDLSGQQAGIYLLQGEVNGKRFTRRLVLE